MKPESQNHFTMAVFMKDKFLISIRPQICQMFSWIVYSVKCGTCCIKTSANIDVDRHCGLVVRVLGYRSGGPGSIPGNTRKKNKVVVLERGPLSLVSTTEELLDRKVAAPV
jgi:hypothetical protein